jgi:hypothetical protein
MRKFQYALLSLLIIFVVWRGIIPAFTHLDTDFPNYYTASRVLLDGKDINRIYDSAWFLQQTNQYGMAFGRLSPFPPITIFVMVPFAWAPPLLALQLWTAFNIILLVAAICLLMKITQKDWLWCSLIMLSSGVALVNNFRFGQFYVILALLVMLIYYGWKKRSPYLSGIALGVGAAVKYFPAVYLIMLAARKEWKTVIAGLITIVVLVGAGIWLLGIEAHRQFVMSVLYHHIDGNIQGQSLFSATFESWNNLLRRLFIYDAAENPSPIMNLPVAYDIFKWSITLVVVSLTVYAYRRAKNVWGGDVMQVQFSLISIAALLLVPASATYHFLLLVLPVALLLSVRSPWSLEQKIILLFYLAIAFMPYMLFRGFDGDGILTILAVPRLWCVTALFAATFRFSIKRP